MRAGGGVSPPRLESSEPSGSAFSSAAVFRRPALTKFTGAVKSFDLCSYKFKTVYYHIS